MSIDLEIKDELKTHINPEKAKFFPKFFKAGPGEYSEGDRFIGVTVPDQRIVAKKYYKKASLLELEKLLSSEIHEYRLTALFILVLKYEKIKDFESRTGIYDFYIKNKEWVNNWDLVDSSAHKIMGRHLYENELPRGILYKFAKTDHLWTQRIAIIATMWFIKQGEFKDTLAVSDILLHHKHDLIHKAVGWMLREVGKQDQNILEEFLESRYKQMPRTMLRYSIEKFEEEERKGYLQGKM